MGEWGIKQLGKHLVWIFFLSSPMTSWGSETIDLTVLHINDLHSQLHAPPSNPFKLGGLARVSTLLKALRSANGLSITLDAGDWSEGTWHYNIDEGANMLSIMGELGVEATVIGNHDFVGGPDSLLEMLASARPSFPVLAANFDLTKYKRATDFRRYIPTSTVIEKGGVKIGLIGLTCWSCLFDSFLDPIKIQEPIRLTKKLAKELRPNVDFLIAISHNYLPLNVILARAVPQLDAVISGHMHKKTVQAEIIERNGRKTPIVEAGDWGTYVGELQLRLDRDKKKVTYVTNHIHPVLPILEEDPLILRRVIEEDERLKNLFGSNPYEVVAHTEIDLDDQYAYHAGLGDLVTKAYRWVSGADVALEVMPLIGTPIAAGPVTVKDIHDVLPHLWDPIQKKEWTVKKLELSGKDLLKILKLQHLPDALPIKRSGLVAFDQLEVTWKPKQGNFGIPKIMSVLVGGKPLVLEKKYTLALTEGTAFSFQLLSKKFHLGFDLSDLQDTGIEAWKAILTYSQQLGVITEAALTAGRKTLTLGPDPAVYQNGIRFDLNQKALLVQVTNQGLVSVQGLFLQCSAGRVNDSVVFGTKEQIYSPIGTALISDLSPEKEWNANIAWHPSAGYWPVRCVVTAKKDDYPANSSAERVIEIPSFSP